MCQGGKGIHGAVWHITKTENSDKKRAVRPRQAAPLTAVCFYSITLIRFSMSAVSFKAGSDTIPPKGIWATST